LIRPEVRRAHRSDGPRGGVERVVVGLVDRAEPLAEVLENRRDPVSWRLAIRHALGQLIS
jgi:hypothetical protein